MATLAEIRKREIAVKNKFNAEIEEWFAEFNARQQAAERSFRDEKEEFLNRLKTREKAAIAEATKGQCIQQVYSYHEWGPHRCERLSGFGSNGDYCKQHAKQHP